VKAKYLDDCLNSKKNNFDFIRFVAAVLVIFSHAYPIANGNHGSEPFGLLTKGQSTFGHLAVITFFIISGFLITQSFDRSKDLLLFIKARILRIFPGLIIAVLLTVFILGPVFTTLPLRDYFYNVRTIEYLKTISLYWIQYDLPGVFEKNIYPVAVNGSLWTLWYEFFFYGVVGFLGITKLLNKWIVTVGLLLSTFLFSFEVGGFYVDLFRYFSVGMMFYLFRNKIILNGGLAILSLIVVFVSMKTGLFHEFFPVFGSYLVFYLAFNQKLKLNNFGKYGDFSYGLYIYAFPVQQIVSNFYGKDVTPLINFLIAFPVTLIFAIISWSFIERNALKLKKISIVKREVSQGRVSL
jgi:peptidoglycan/LPS O-acetylase OafA/YrhL